MPAATIIRSGVSWAGIFAGPAAWASSFLANYMLTPWQCGSKIVVVPWLSVAGIALAAAGGLLSYRAVAASSHGTEPPRTVTTRAFLAHIGVAAAALFALIMLLQGMAGFVFDGCER